MTCLIQPFDPSRHADFLMDESMRSGRAESISFPKEEKEVRQILETLRDQRVPVTIQGSLTGIAGDGVPSGGHVLNLSAMNRIIGMGRDDRGHYCLRMQPGVSLAALRQQLASRRFEQASEWDSSSLAELARFKKETGSWFWPPDPTEDTASIGGMAATNARGLCVHAYGLARQHIQRVQGMDCLGVDRVFDRGEDLDLFTDWKKSPVVITELTLRLVPEPICMWGIVFFFPATAPAAAFIESLESIKETPSADSRLASVEILDQKSLEIIDHFKENHPSFRDLPHVDTTAGMAVYLELHGEDETAMADLAEQLMDAVRENEGDPDASLAATIRGDLSRLRLFRKAAPHAANFLTARARQTDDRIIRLGYDWMQSWPSLDEPFKRIESDMTGAGVTGAVYGHALDQCLHVNLLPCDYATYRAGKQLIRQWSQTESKGHL